MIKIILSLLFFLFVICPVSASAVTYSDSVVTIITDEYVKNNEYAETQITFYQLPNDAADIDLAFGVSDGLRFTDPEYYNPHYGYWEESHRKKFLNAVIIGPYYGDTIEYGTLDCPNRYILEVGGIRYHVGIDWYESNGHDIDIVWHTHENGIIDWSPIPLDRIQVINQVFDDKNKWYVIRNIPAVEGETLRIRAKALTPHKLGPQEYKYDVATKLSADSIQTAISTGRFKYVDPYGAADNFNLTIDTTKTSTGSTTSTQFKLPLEATGTYNFTVWWDGTEGGDHDHITTWNQANVTHTYSVAGVHDIVISGTLIGWRFNNAGDRLKLTDISNWGDLRLGNSNGYFYGAENFNASATDTLNLSGTTTLAYAFRNATLFNTNLSGVDTSNIVSMIYTFSGATVFNGNITTWDTSSLTESYYMFDSASNFNQNISGWDMTDVTNMAAMFSSASTFNQPIGSWDTSSVVYMDNVFNGAISFNQDLSSWDVTALTSAINMFLTSGLSQTNYNLLLIGWGAQTVNAGVTFSAGYTTCSGDSALNSRYHLTNTHAWTITDGGPPQSLSTPVNNSVVYTTYPPLQDNTYFSWVSSTGTTAYQLQVSTQGSFNILEIDTLMGPACSTQTLDVNLKHYFRVRSYSNNVWSGWSFVSDFTLTGNSSSDGSTGIHGVVFDSADDTPLSGVTVTIRNATWTDSTSTGTNGYYLFNNLQNVSTYYITVSKYEYDTITDMVITTINGTWTVFDIGMMISTV